MCVRECVCVSVCVCVCVCLCVCSMRKYFIVGTLGTDSCPAYGITYTI